MTTKKVGLKTVALLICVAFAFIAATHFGLSGDTVGLIGSGLFLMLAYLVVALTMLSAKASTATHPIRQESPSHWKQIEHIRAMVDLDVDLFRMMFYKVIDPDSIKRLSAGMCADGKRAFRDFNLRENCWPEKRDQPLVTGVTEAIRWGLLLI